MTYGDVMSTAHELPELGFGDRLHRYRLSRGMTLRQFAEGTNVSHATIGRYERIGGNLSDPAVQRLAKLLQLRHGVPAEWLLQGTAPDPKTEGRTVAGAGFEPATSGLHAWALAA